MWTFYNASGEQMIIDGGLHDILEDTTPQLGGNLDMQANLLVGNGGSTGIAISAAGEVTMAAQPAFMAYLGSTDSNQTGGGGAYTLGSGNALTEVFDQNADFVTTGTFTAPITGRYMFAACIRCNGVTAAADDYEIRISSSNRAYIRNVFHINTMSTRQNPQIVAIVDLDAADTATVILTGTGESGDVWDIAGDSDAVTYIGAYLFA